MWALVVEDDLRELEEHVDYLQRRGVRVIPATNLEDAKRLYLENRGKLDGVILDGCVPDMRHTTLPLIGQMVEDKHNKLFHGKMVAASGDRILRREMLAAGCNAESPKDTAAEVLTRLLGA